MSFASFAIGSNEVVATSIVCSTAVFTISAISTKAIARIRAISSNRVTPLQKPATSTANAIAKWIRMFRWVRSTWMMPSKAKLNDSKTDVRLLTGAPPRVPPSRRRGRSRAGAARRARAARATPRRRPADTRRRRRAGVAARPAARRAHRSGTRARRSPRRCRGARASGRGSPAAGRTRVRARRRSLPRPRPSALTLGAGLLGVALVRLDDALHELVPDDVLVAEADEGDPVDVAEDVGDRDQARGLLARQVDLRHVAGDDDLRA